MNLSDLTQGWRRKSSIKPDPCLAPKFWGGGDGKEMMTFQTTVHNVPLITMRAHFLHSACREGVVGGVARGEASFSTRCRPGWQSFPNILKIAHMTSMHWPHQHFELRDHPKMHHSLQAVEWLNKKFVGPGLSVYNGLATPLVAMDRWGNQFTATWKCTCRNGSRKKKPRLGQRACTF